MHDYSSAYRGKFSSRHSKRRFDDDEPTTAKRVRRRRTLPPIEVFGATDGLPEVDRWSTWDKTQNLVPNDPATPPSAGVRPARNNRQRKFYQPHDDEATYVKRAWELRRLAAPDADDATDGLPEGDRWSTWDQVTPTERGPKPYPKWLVTDLAAVDYELGVLKTGKEADVFLVRRGVPGTDRSCLLAAKRYRDATHRQFHRDTGYLEGRRTRDTRVTRAAANRTAFGRQAIAGQWASAEFNALVRLHNVGVPVPYPVQILGTEILLEFIGDEDGTGAPRLAETRPGPSELASLWSQLVEAMATLASAGFAHGDLSPYNLLVHYGRLVMIDLPQVVDVISNPNGRGFLDRDAKNVATWFARAGHPDADPEVLARLLAEEARLALAGGRRVVVRTGRRKPLTAIRSRTDDGQLNLPGGGHGELPGSGQRDYFA